MWDRVEGTHTICSKCSTYKILTVLEDPAPCLHPVMQTTLSPPLMKLFFLP